jgi:hypothetical protein
MHLPFTKRAHGYRAGYCFLRGILSSQDVHFLCPAGCQCRMARPMHAMYLLWLPASARQPDSKLLHNL